MAGLGEQVALRPTAAERPGGQEALRSPGCQKPQLQGSAGTKLSPRGGGGKKHDGQAWAEGQLLAEMQLVLCW